MEIYRGREIETEQLSDGKWIVCAQDNNGVMVIARPGWHYITEEEGIEDVEKANRPELLKKTPENWRSGERSPAVGAVYPDAIQPVEPTDAKVWRMTLRGEAPSRRK